jgi:cysteine synthase A
MKADTILETIGNTPHVRINRLFGADANVWVKSERANPGGSIKDRIALAWSRRREVGASSNPAAPSSSRPAATPASGLAMVAAVKGYKLILVMPDSMSVERRRLMLAYGASST